MRNLRSRPLPIPIMRNRQNKRIRQTAFSESRKYDSFSCSRRTAACRTRRIQEDRKLEEHRWKESPCYRSRRIYRLASDGNARSGRRAGSRPRAIITHLITGAGLRICPALATWKSFAGTSATALFAMRSSKGQQIVFNLAALIAIPYSYVAPQSYIDTNVCGALNICQAARDHGVERVIQNLDERGLRHGAVRADRRKNTRSSRSRPTAQARSARMRLP